MLMHAAAAGQSAMFSTVVGEMSELWLAEQVGQRSPSSSTISASVPTQPPQLDDRLPRCSTLRIIQS